MSGSSSSEPGFRSGLAAAIGAAARGCRVTLQESADLIGGAAAYSGARSGSGTTMSRSGTASTIRIRIESSNPTHRRIDA